MTAALRLVDDPAASSAALYVRRSHKDADGSARNGHSLQEQERDCRALAGRLGLEVVEVYAEREGTGASARSRKARPVWERALADLDDGGRFRTLIVWALDRADRRGAREVVDLLERHAGRNRRVLGVDGTDTGDERRRLELVIRAEIAREEAENIARRVTRTKRSRRDAGRWLGGRPPYGLQVVDGGLDHDPATYPVARRIAEEALAGRSLYAIARDLTTEAVPSPRGGAWRAGAVGQILRAPAFAGLAGDRRRTASGGWAAVAEVYVDDDGETVSVGRGVISPGERARLLRVLESRTKDTHAGRKGSRSSGSVLGEVLRCASCGGRTGVSGSEPYRSLRCSDAVNAPGSCDGFSAPLRATVEAVSEAFLRRLATLEPDEPLVHEIASRWVAQVDPTTVEERRVAEDAVEEARAALARVQDLAVAGVLTPEEAGERTPALRERLVRAEERLSRVAQGGALDVSPVLDLAQSREAWEALDGARKRDLLGLAISRVDVTRAGGRGRHFRPEERVRITWTDGTVTAAPALR